MTEQEIADELLRITERLKIDDARRAVPADAPYGEPGTVADLRRPYAVSIDTPNIDATMFPGSEETRGRMSGNFPTIADAIQDSAFTESLLNPRSEQRPSIGELPEDASFRRDMSQLLQGRGFHAKAIEEEPNIDPSGSASPARTLIAMAKDYEPTVGAHVRRNSKVGEATRDERALRAAVPEPTPGYVRSDQPSTVASTGGPSPVLTPQAREFFMGNERAIMEPDLQTTQSGGYGPHNLPPNMTSVDGVVVFRDTGEPVPVTRRPSGFLPLTVNAASGKLEWAMPRGLDVIGQAMPSTKGAMIAKGVGMTPIELAPGEVVLGAGAIKGRRPPPGGRGGDGRPLPRSHNQPPEPLYPQYAENYPEPGPPKMEWDPKKKREYEAKQLTPEAEAFQKTRKKIMDDMEARGFEPYFDPAKREHVDPTNYPTAINTLEDVPKKAATAEKHMARAGSDEARAALQEAYRAGSELPDAKNWYAMKQLEDAFIKELGPEAGRKAFADKFATSMAATTGGSDPRSNFLMAMYGNYLKEKGLATPPESHQMPFPIGGRYAGGNMAMFDKLMRDYGGIEALTLQNPKRHDFAFNFLGHRNKATMDEQMTSGMTPGLKEPPWYGIWEKVLHEEAAKAGVSPRDFQDVAWAGFKRGKEPTYTGEPMIQTVNKAIERTARLTGVSPEEIVRRGIIRSEIPIYSRTAPPLPRKDEDERK